jgi:hypothetical protein
MRSAGGRRGAPRGVIDEQTYLKLVDVDVDVDLQVRLERGPAPEPAHAVEALPVGILIQNLEDVLVDNHPTGRHGTRRSLSSL